MGRPETKNKETRYPEFGRRFKEARARKGFSTEQVAKTNGVNASRQSVEQWESGKTKPDIDKWAPLSDLVSLPIEFFFEALAPEILQKLSVQRTIPHYKVSETAATFGRPVRNVLPIGREAWPEDDLAKRIGALSEREIGELRVGVMAMLDKIDAARNTGKKEQGPPK